MKTPFISVIMPCLNEEKSVGKCVESATKSLKEPRLLPPSPPAGGFGGASKELKFKKIDGEVMVVDNGSTDKSIEIAKKAGASVIIEKNKGYGNALLRGMKEAKGEIIVMGDSDGSYDWGEIGKLVTPFFVSVQIGDIERAEVGKPFFTCGPCQELVPSDVLARKSSLRALDGTPSAPATRLIRRVADDALRTSPLPYQKPDLMIGSRLRGEIESGAMPFLNRYFGTPILNFFLRLFFGIKLSDSQSGFRAFRKSAIEKLNLKSGGMEFASEMLVKAKQAGLGIYEVPISYHRRAGRSKLSPVRDAWRHIKFMLLFSPTWLFLIPGGTIGLIGLISLIRLSFGPLFIGQRYFDIHTMIVTSFVTTLGFQIVFLGLFAKVYASIFLEQKDNFIEALLHWFSLEKGLVVGGVLGFWGMLGFLGVFGSWVKGGFGELTAARPVLLSVTILSLAVQAIFSSFFFALLGSKWER